MILIMCANLQLLTNVLIHTVRGICCYRQQSKTTYSIYFRKVCECFVGLGTCVLMYVLGQSYCITKAR